MEYLILAVPVAAAFAAVQYLLCQKAKKSWQKAIPLFFAALIFAAAAVVTQIESVANELAAKYVWRFFAAFVYLGISGMAAFFGTAAGWLLWLIKRKKKAE